MARLATGIPELDSLLYGGFPDKSVIMLMGFPGCGYVEFAQQFMCYGLQHGCLGEYFTSRRTAQEVLESMKFIDPDVTEHFDTGKLTFVDAYTSRLREFASQMNLPTTTEDLGEGDAFWNIDALERLNIFISEAKEKEGEIRGIVDNLSYLLRNESLEEVVDLVEKLEFRTRILGGVYLLILIEAMHDERTIATISDIVDGIIQFVEKQKGTSLETNLRFIKMEKTDFNTRTIPYIMVKTGIPYRTTIRGIEVETTRRIY